MMWKEHTPVGGTESDYRLGRSEAALVDFVVLQNEDTEVKNEI